jgi:hypothetical protein
LKTISTVPRWPNFQPNNSKQALKKIFGGKIGAIELPSLFKSDRKEAGIFFLNYEEEKPVIMRILLDF